MNRICKELVLVSASFIFLVNSAYTARIINEISIPAEREAHLTSTQARNAMRADTAINTFSFDKKTVLRDPSTGSARRVIGVPERIPGFSVINEANVEAAASAFLKIKENELGLKGVVLKLKNKTHVNGRWYVSYCQVYEGVEVLLTEAVLRIFDNGNVAMYGADVIPELKLNTSPKFSYENSIKSLIMEVGEKAHVDALQEAKTPYILPLKNGTGVVCNLVWRAELISAEGKRFINYIDANEGNTIWRFEKTRSSSNSAFVSGFVREKNSVEAPKRLKFANLKVNVGGTAYYTDQEGEISLENSSATPLVATLQGKYAKVSKKNGGGPAAKLIDTLRPGYPLYLTWNDSNSHAFERSAYYHTDLIHNDLKSVDPNLTVMDFPMAVVIDYAGQAANAYSNGRDSIVFVAAENPEANMAETPSIIYHEYTHSLNGLFYESLGEIDGMVNASANEALADLYACLLQGQSKIGLGAFKDDSSKFLRCIDNDNVYPDSIGSDPHYNGLILAGAYWDLAKATSVDFVKKLSHFVKYATPDDPNIGVAYTEWFLETLIADDDDGDLTNGSPHFNEIVAAFNKRHIGSDLLLALSFSYMPVADMQDTLSAIPIEFSLKASCLHSSNVQNPIVVFSTDNWATKRSVASEKIGSDIFKAFIPKMPAGTFVSYYIQANDFYSGREINLIQEKFKRGYLNFAVGYKTAAFDDCESGAEWSYGDGANDTGNNGFWACAEPGLVDLTELTNGYFGLMQLDNDHTENGSKCFVTDPTGLDLNEPSIFGTFMVIGRTTLYSPVYTLKGLDKPILKFWRYNYFQLLNYDEEKPSLQVLLSTNEGAAWIEVARFENSTTDWEPELINLQHVCKGAELVQFKFVAENLADLITNRINLCEAMIDDLEILALNGTLNASEEKTITSFYVYPNPASERIMATAHENGVLTITDALGTIISQTPVVEGRNMIDVNKLKAGLYFAKITSSGCCKVAKFIKK